MRLIKRSKEVKDLKIENNKFVSSSKIGQRDTIEFVCSVCNQIATRRVSCWEKLENLTEEDFICSQCQRDDKNIKRTKEEWQEIENKRKQYKKEKYGNENFNNREMAKNTNLKKYGGNAPICSEEIKSKIKNTNLKKYGVENTFLLHQPKEIEKRKKESYEIRKNFPNVEITTSYKEYNGVRNNYIYRCRICGNEFSFFSEVPTIEPRCQYCFSLNSSSYEKEMEDFIKSFAPEIKTKKNDRTLIKPYEIDLLILEKQIGFEIDGLFWHNEENLAYNNKSPRIFHLYKTNKAKEKNISLFHIFEDEWIYQKDIVKSRIKNILGFYEQKFFARKCIIKKVDNDLKNSFLNENHIQGEDRSSVKLGLFHQEELVSVMTFAKDKSGNGWDLTRFANKKNTLVIGGASKLLQYFIKNYSPEYIISFSDKRWSNGNLYKTLGFENVKTNPPAYWYVKNNKRFHRFNFRREHLKKFKEYDESLSEKEIMKKAGFKRIWDCGYDVWKLNLI